MADLSVNIAGVEFKNPIIAASGTIGFGHEYSEFYPLEELVESLARELLSRSV